MSDNLSEYGELDDLTEVYDDCEVGKASQITIKLSQRLVDEGDELVVDLEKADLGDQLYIHSITSTMITLIFKPFLSFEDKTVNVTVSSKETGKKQTRILKLTASPPSPQEVSVREMVGNRCDKVIPLRNLNPFFPIHVRVMREKRVPREFSFPQEGEWIRINPSSSCSFPLYFFPSSLDSQSFSMFVEVREEGLVDPWELAFVGEGLDAGQMKHIEGYCTMGETSTLLVPFTNPSDDRILLRLALESPSRSMRLVQGSLRVGDEGSSMLSSWAQEVESKRSVQIPVLFAPETPLMSPHVSLLTMSCEELGLAWQVSITGKVLVPCLEQVITVSSFTHQTSMDSWDFPYVSEVLKLDASHFSLDDFSFHFSKDFGDSFDRYEEDETILDKLLSKWLSASLKEQTPGFLSLKVGFCPLRPISTTVFLYIDHLPSGTSFSFPVILEVQHDLEGVMLKDPSNYTLSPTIEAEGASTLFENEVGTSLSKAISIHSPFISPLPFEATLLTGSSPEFSISPTRGVLYPSEEGSVDICTVTFSPSSYSGTMGKSGVLIIKTDECEWIHHLKGRQPSYRKPEVASKVMNFS
jgi:hypothetical protein